MKPKTIILAGGGSGGHITPLLPLAHVLRRRCPKCRLIYIGLRGDKLDGVKERFGIFDQVFFVTSGKFRRYHDQSLLARLVDIKTIILNIKDFFKVLYGAFSARRLLKKLKPDVIFSKGGYVVVPIGLAARSLHIPIITHDSDAEPGLANRLVGRWAKIHTSGMPVEYYTDTYPAGTVKYVGVPTDERIRPVTPDLQIEYKKQLELPADSFVLLVAGGGLGSKTLNDKTLAIAPQLLKADAKSHILHFTGSQHEMAVKQKYHQILSDEQLKRVKVVGFSDQFYKYSGAADLVIARAGASTLAELAVAAKACIIMPAAFLTGGHQLKNAQELKIRQAAIIEDDKLSPQKLLKLTEQLRLNPKRRRELADNLGSMARPDAADKLADLILA
ncbi:hypothetical protein A3F05_00170 [Candidatus Saccharibacteria bacterium RIFCSPHIGHO2_12_FULL_47_17]|nr:MAG: hypothetical protein A3F05_00170 [Candidatus Saccharibacteria bacterium RIFCSPHIGHO2_12_FULL_47_17]